VLCLFPFEPPLLREHGVAATYVGHPLADAIPLECRRAGPPRAALGLSPTTPWWRCCPAAGESEIRTSRRTFPAAAAL
jgi:lipid-A-disaccharide synthase